MSSITISMFILIINILIIKLIYNKEEEEKKQLPNKDSNHKLHAHIFFFII